ncbi:MAG: hypothetical protein K0R38_2019 [Polyangiaceae bacterium]|jgi:hypothetical protein|nr:hypothetical protein [Polyangiaceae bacterium]
MISNACDLATEEGSGGTREHLTTAGVIESAARQLGEGFEIERRESGAAQRRTGNVPKLPADPCAAVSWENVDDIDLDAHLNAFLTRWTAADEPHHLVRDCGDHVDSICRLQ